jgi:hypothetical protein
MFLTAIFLSGCGSVAATLELPTLIPTEHLPTAIALTSQALITEEAAANQEIEPEPTRARLTPTSTIAPTISPTLDPTSTPAATKQGPSATPPPPFAIPYANIQFINPGALSRVISPIGLHVYLLPGDNRRARVELYGEDGRLMYQKLFVFGELAGVQTNLRTEIDFELNGVAETAKLAVSVTDGYGRIKALASQDLILLSLGEADINPPGDLLEPIVIQQPAPKVMIQGGSLMVSGLVRTTSDRSLLIELVATDGRTIGSRLAGIAPEPQGGHRFFAAEVPYTVAAPTWTRVTVSERSNGFGGPVQINSVEVLLAP